MIRTTRAQRIALKQLFDRAPTYAINGGVICSTIPHVEPLTYRQFRTYVRAGYDCIMLHWCGMWIGIEPDGYTHS